CLKNPNRERKEWLRSLVKVRLIGPDGSDLDADMLELKIIFSDEPMPGKHRAENAICYLPFNLMKVPKGTSKENWKIQFRLGEPNNWILDSTIKLHNNNKLEIEECKSDFLRIVSEDKRVDLSKNITVLYIEEIDNGIDYDIGIAED